MGLDAVVYRNRAGISLRNDIDPTSLQTDKLTGEVFATKSAIELPREDVVAIEKRIGNSSEVSALRNEVRNLLGDNSLLLVLVLRNGTHSGDTVPTADIEQLDKEISQLKSKTDVGNSLGLNRFIADIQELITAAKQQQNPITFV